MTKRCWSSLFSGFIIRISLKESLGTKVCFIGCMLFTVKSSQLRAQDFQWWLTKFHIPLADLNLEDWLELLCLSAVGFSKGFIMRGMVVSWDAALLLLRGSWELPARKNSKFWHQMVHRSIIRSECKVVLINPFEFKNENSLEINPPPPDWQKLGGRHCICHCREHLTSIQFKMQHSL